MMKINFAVYCAVFIALAILANWFWFPEYLLLGIVGVSMVAIIAGFVKGVLNTIKDADNKTAS